MREHLPSCFLLALLCMACLDFLMAAQRNNKQNNSMSVKQKNLNLAFQNNRDDRKGAIYSEVAELLQSTY